jgi:hypothetical protein
LYEAAVVHLNEIANNLRLLVKSSEQHRETHAQFIKSGIGGAPTEELLRITGLKERPNADSA